MTEVLLVYAAALLLAWPLGRYMALVFSQDATVLDRWFRPIERILYRAIGARPAEPMDWKRYAKSLLRLQVIVALVALGVFVAQGHLPLNPDHIHGMSWDLALHTAASFITNTDQQHYAGQAQLSYFAQMVAIITMQFISPATGLAALVAILRALFPRRAEQSAKANGEAPVGNFYQDLVRGIVRILLPLSLVMAVTLTWQGVPATFHGAWTVHPLDPTAGAAVQRIPVGPVAPLVAIKQLGTNGGGWYGANSATPLENPTPFSDFLEMVAILLLPIAQVFMAGRLTGRRRLARSILAVMLVLSAALSGLAVWSELQPNPAFAGLAARGPNLEGKEVRFGAVSSALWASLATQTSNGSVNAMLDSFNPLGGLSCLFGMFINATFGGIGVGLINYLLYLLLAAFLGSLMVGRTPEFYGRALDAKEIKLISLTLLLQPLLVLGLTALAVAIPGFAHNSNPGFHGFTEVLYEYTSAFANNGSGFAGLGNGTVWWNVSCSVALIIGRYIPLLAPLAIAAHMATKRTAPVGLGNLDAAAPTFSVFTLGVMVLFTLLSFLPAVALGPIAEALSLHG